MGRIATEGNGHRGKKEHRRKHTQQEQLVSNEMYFISACHSYVRIGSWTDSAVALKMPMPLRRQAVRDSVHKIGGWRGCQDLNKECILSNLLFFFLGTQVTAFSFLPLNNNIDKLRGSFLGWGGFFSCSFCLFLFSTEFAFLLLPLSPSNSPRCLYACQSTYSCICECSLV